LFALTSAELLADTWRTGGVTLLGLAGYFFCPCAHIDFHAARLLITLQRVMQLL